MRTRTALLFALVTTFWSSSAFAQYSKHAGRSAPAESMEVQVVDEVSGKVRTETRKVEVQRDDYGNAAGSSYDLAVDGAFTGQTIVMVQLFDFDFSQAREALERKGFSVVRFSGTTPPSPKELEKALKKANQFWLVSDCAGQRLNTEHADVIKAFFDKGHGVYIWGDNQPCYADANFVSKRLFDVTMSGDVPGDQTVTLKTEKNKSGLLRDHLLSTGVENIYEGITIATIDTNEVLTPLLWGSAGNVVAAFYDQKGKRAIVDGGFTRLYFKWDRPAPGATSPTRRPG